VKPSISIKIIVDAITAMLDTTFGFPVRTSPPQQRVNCPYFIILPRNAATITKRINRQEYEPKFDIVYVENFNLSDAFDRCTAIANQLDSILELIPAIDGNGNQFLIRTYNRMWSVDMAELHYFLDLRVFVSNEKDPGPLMEDKTLTLQICAASAGESCAVYISEQERG